MKRLNSFFILTTAALVFTTSSCKKGFLEGYNTDPNNPVAVSPNLLLTSAEVATSYTYGGDYCRYAEMWVQHLAGTDRQFSAIGTYTIQETDVDNVWRFNAYGGGMEDLNTLITDGDANGNHIYAGIARVLMAANLGLLTDTFGDIPYSQAFQGAANTTPAFDSQESIYNSIFSLLDQAVTDLTSTTDAIVPGADDLMYGGDPAKWTMVAHGLEARYRLHLGLRDASNYTAALNAIDAGGLSSNDDDLDEPFSSDVTGQNLWYQFDDQRSGYISMGAYFINQMNTLSDPREPFYATTNVDGVYNGANPGDATSDQFSVMGTYYASDVSPIPIFSYVEQEFIESEAAFQSGDKVRAAEAYNEGVTVSLAKYGIDDPAYLAANATETDATITLEKIIGQKYLGDFTSFESWTDYRRTGLPAITPATGQVPVRMPYPQTERLYNPNTPANLTTSDHVWWDL